MIDVLVTGLLVGFVLYHAWCERRHAAERKYLLNAVLARTPAELIALEQEPTKPRRRKGPDQAEGVVRQFGA